MPNFDVLSPIKHDGILYKVGGVIEAEAEKLAELIGLGHVIPSADDTNTPPSDHEARVMLIVGAIGKLEPDNSDLWLKDGKPATEAIAEITGWPVAAAERNEAWEIVQEAKAKSDTKE